MVCLFGCLASVSGQERQTTLDKLTAKEWYSKYPNREISWTENYDRAIVVGTLVIEDGRSASVQKTYHLSDTPAPIFDRSKVGKVEQGSYIIEFDEERKKTDVFHILSLTDTELTLQGLSNPDMLPDPITYEAREKQK